MPIVASAYRTSCWFFRTVYASTLPFAHRQCSLGILWHCFTTAFFNHSRFFIHIALYRVSQEMRKGTKSSIDCKGYFLRFNKLCKISCHLARAVCKNEYFPRPLQNKSRRTLENAATLLRGNISCNHTFQIQIDF